MKKSKVFLITILILCCLSLFFACSDTKQRPAPPKNIPEIIENTPFVQDDNLTQENNLAQEDTDQSQLTEEENPHTKEDYQKPTEPIVLAPFNNPRPKLYHIDKRWTATVPKGQILDALEKMKIKVASISPIIVDTKDEQGCCAIISIGGRLIDAYEFCQRLNLPSSYITDIKIDNDNIIFEGQGSFDPDGYQGITR
ncbi:MAG: hypothetical protein GX756_06350 [Clostridiales bacterium]|nr:hypothetical protein [Clostridiales bacterium]